MHTAGGDSPWGGLFTMSTTVEMVLEGQLIWGGVEGGEREGRGSREEEMERGRREEWREEWREEGERPSTTIVPF